MQSILGGAVISLFLIALYAPWFTKPSMLVAIVVSVLVNMFLMAGCSGLLPPTGVGCCQPSACLCACILNLHVSVACLHVAAVQPDLFSPCVICLIVHVQLGFALSDICMAVCLSIFDMVICMQPCL